MAKAVLTFAVYRGDELLGRETLAHDIIKVGKDPKSHLQVDDEAASRMHAVIEVAGPDDVTLIDLGNDPGTIVNGEKVNKCKLSIGDKIEVGGVQIMLEKAEAEGVAAPAQEAPAEPAPPASNPFAKAGAAAANPFADASSGQANPFADASPGVGSLGANPFGAGAAVAARDAVYDVPDDAAPGPYTYTLVKSGPDDSLAEVETADAAVEIMVLWGVNVIHVSHLSPPRNFYVGEDNGKDLKCDFLMPPTILGTTRMPVVVADVGSLSVVIPAGASGHIELPGQPRMTLDEARQKAQPCAELSGAHQIALPSGGKARIELGDMVFMVGAVNAGKPVAHGVASGIDWTILAYFGMSMSAVGGLILAMAYFTPPLGLLDDEGFDKDQMYLIQQYLDALAEKEEEEEEQEADDDAVDTSGGTGDQHKDEEGAMGKEESKDTNKRYQNTSRAEALRDAMEFGIIGLLNTGAAGDPNAPVIDWADPDPNLESFNGNMWGDDVGDAYGGGGLGLSGIGEGGGGRGEGIGLGSIGTFGHGAGTGTGQGFGSGHGRLGGGHKTKVPRVRMGATQVSGRLPKEVIQRIVRQNYGRFRLCYEQGLQKNPNLQGRVAVRFVIGRNGAVSNVGNGGSDIPDSGVVSCVVRAYYGLSFPPPEGGIVTVVYPIMFSPGG